MAITVIPKYDISETVANDGSADLPYTVLGTVSPLAVRAAVLLSSPVKYHELCRQTMSIDHNGGGVWSVKVKYARVENKITMQLDTMCEKVKITRSLRTIRNYQVRDVAAFGTEGDDYGQLIGVSKDKVEGVDVYAKGMFKLQMQWSSKYDTIPSNYIGTCKGLGATVNDADLILHYKGQSLLFLKGELLFIGATFQESSDNGCEITLKFEGSDNDPFITVGDLNGSTFITFTGDTVVGDSQITNIPSTAFFAEGMVVEGFGIPAGTTIDTVIDGTTVTLSEAADQAAVGTTFKLKFPYVEKRGWEYAWVRTTKTKGIHGAEVETPESVHIEQVYEYGNFDLLGVFDTITDFQDDLDNKLSDEQDAEEGP